MEIKKTINEMQKSLKDGELIVFIGNNENYEIGLNKHEEFEIVGDNLTIIAENRVKKVINLFQINYILIREELV